MASPNYQHCYKILDLSPKADWAQVSAAHRRLVQIWHPDRYQGGDPEAARKVFVESNMAYNHLKNYYKKHNSLPVFNSGREIEASSTGHHFHTKGSVSHFNNAPLNIERVKSRIVFRFFHLQIALLISVIISVLLLLKGMDDQSREQLIDEGHEIKSSLQKDANASDNSSTLE